jgi:hypothetical protein
MENFPIFCLRGFLTEKIEVSLESICSIIPQIDILCRWLAGWKGQPDAASYEYQNQQQPP